MSGFLGIRSPFFLPLWRRVLTVAVCLGWAAFEFAGGAVFWAILFGALGLYAAYEFFLAFYPANYRDKDPR